MSYKDKLRIIIIDYLLTIKLDGNLLRIFHTNV